MKTNTDHTELYKKGRQTKEERKFDQEMAKIRKGFKRPKAFDHNSDYGTPSWKRGNR